MRVVVGFVLVGCGWILDCAFVGVSSCTEDQQLCADTISDSELVLCFGNVVSFQPSGWMPVCFF